MDKVEIKKTEGPYDLQVGARVCSESVALLDDTSVVVRGKFGSPNTVIHSVRKIRVQRFEAGVNVYLEGWFVGRKEIGYHESIQKANIQILRDLIVNLD